ncbi:MAG: hypothetical protein ACRCT6_00310 [Notoacmeibacter sp.]
MTMLDGFDGEFSRRFTPDNWQRTIETRSQPGFVKAVLDYHSGLASQIKGNTILNKVSAEAQRYELLAYTMFLSDNRDSNDPRSGLTLGNLERICTEQKCASPGRVRAYVGLLWVAGYLQRHQSAKDRRRVHFEPTAKLIRSVEEWNQRIFKAIDGIFPQDQLALRHLNEPRFGSNMRKNGVQQILTGFKPFDLFPEVYHFVARDSGWLLLIQCVGQMMLDAKQTIVFPVSVDLQNFGKQYGVSRSHLRRVLESAFDEGLLDAPPQNGSHIVLSEKLIAAYFTSMAAELSFYRAHALGTTA